MKRFLSSLVLLGTLAASLNANAYTLGPTTPGKWGSPVMGTGATITWSVMSTGTSCAAEFAGCSITSFADILPSGWQTAVNNAFAAWSAVANITFVQVADDGAAFNAATNSGDIRLGAHIMDGVSGTLAHGYYAPVNGGSAAGDIHLDQAESWKLNFGGPGFSIFQVLAHEIGHAIGLDHSTVPGSLMNPFYSEAFSGLQADDIAGAQFIYGAAQQQVPEPDVLALLGLALAGLALSRKQKVSALS